MAFVDDADWHQHHPRAHIESPRQEKVDVGLLQLELAGFLQALDQRVLKLQLSNETDAIREGVSKQQNEAMKVDPSILELRFVEMQIHVARDGRAGLRGPGLRVLCEKPYGKQTQQECWDEEAAVNRAGESHFGSSYADVTSARRIAAAAGVCTSTLEAARDPIVIR